MNTKRKKHLFSAVAFVIGLLLLVYLIVIPLRPKRNDGYLQMYNYYGQDAGTVDVVLLGTSQMGNSAAAWLLWQEQGISAYNLWSGGQLFWDTYHRLIEALKYQDPKVVVLDMRAVIQSGSDYTPEYWRIGNVQGMRWSRNKIATVVDSSPKEGWLDVLLELPITHGSYADLTAQDFQYYFGNYDVNDKGDAIPTYNVTKAEPISVEELSQVREKAQITEKSETFLRKIIETCRDREVPLLLVNMPTATQRTYERYYNCIPAIAGEYGVPYLNYNLIDCEYDPLTGLGDLTHMNMTGARAIIGHLGSYLKETYDLPDHRGDPAYESWEKYVHLNEAAYLKKITDLQGYINELDASSGYGGAYYGYQYYITEYKRENRWDANDDAFVKEELLRIGCDLNSGTNTFLNTWALDSRGQSAVQYAAYAEAKKGLDLNGTHFETDPLTLEVKVNGVSAGKFSTSGVMIVVYDPYLEKIVDAAEFTELLSYRSIHKLKS